MGGPPPDAPTVDPVDPSSGETGVAVDADIVFDIYENGGGVDETTLTIEVDFVVIYENETPVVGWSVNLSPITTPDDGFRVAASHTVDWGNNQTVLVEASVESFGGAPGSQDWSFTTEVATNKPYIDNPNPAASSSGNPSNTPLQVSVVDDDNDVVSSSVEILIDGAVAWTSDAPGSGFVGYKYSVDLGYRYALFKQTEYTNGTHTVRITASDASSNTLDDSYTFGTNVATSTCDPLLWGQFNWGAAVWGCAGSFATAADEGTQRDSYLTGIAFPLQFLPNADIVLDTDEANINSNIRLAVFVRPFGIPLLPLGVGLEDYAFDPLDEVLEAELEVHITDGVENSVDVVVVNKNFTVTENENTLQIVIPYLNTRINKEQNSVIATERHKVD